MRQCSTSFGLAVFVAGLSATGFTAHARAAERIMPTDGFGLPSGEIYGRLIEALRSGDKAGIADTFVREHGVGARS